MFNKARLRLRNCAFSVGVNETCRYFGLSAQRARRTIIAGCDGCGMSAVLRRVETERVRERARARASRSRVPSYLVVPFGFFSAREIFGINCTTGIIRERI